MQTNERKKGKSGAPRASTLTGGARGVLLPGVVLLASVAMIAPATAQAAGSAPVTIVNPLPLPVTGSTTVSGSVQVNGTVSVQDVDSPARRPFQFVLCQTASFGGGNPGTTCTQHSFQVPAGQRLVIEYLSGDCFFTPSVVTSIQLAVGTRVGGTSAAHNIHLLANALDPRQLDFAHQARIYADPDTSVGLNFGASAGPGTGSVACSVTLSGYSVTL